MKVGDKVICLVWDCEATVNKLLPGKFLTSYGRIRAYRDYGKSWLHHSPLAAILYLRKNK